eukprot:jgi/Bigna1/82031/fgenesh1_pg.87_\
MAECCPDGLRIREPLKVRSGNSFNFNDLKNTKFIVIVVSTKNGYPPDNFWKFYYHLKKASENGKKKLTGLQHAVFGNGDPAYGRLYMNIPRAVDVLLERAGSRRFFARGENNEYFAPHETKTLTPEEWAEGMWKAMMKDAESSQAPVDFGATWSISQRESYNMSKGFKDYTIRQLKRKFKVLKDLVPSFAASPDDQLVEKKLPKKLKVKKKYKNLGSPLIERHLTKAFNPPLCHKYKRGKLPETQVEGLSEFVTKFLKRSLFAVVEKN